ncbi:DUF3325 domain-containing protein [Roseateles sp. SL47]|jgi:NaMN:DMB phosphoribosyltransferase|uniref:DUF3325 domain-containing protein n=1 Tax=Roseateles sp. SL47 TaxID=2995138 RepID=UPI0022703550|nr:DUF3325 domain-containing protein [Roseateles sp. SL47]WAC71194.1 DUF3325 domain-containing protein [Roseateles sp. SL47]
MVDPLLLQLAAAGAAIVGFGWLALAMDVHWEQAQGQRPQPAPVVRLLRVLGSLALAASLGLCLTADHASMAVLVWFMLLAAAVLTVAMTLSWRPQWLRCLWP